MTSSLSTAAVLVVFPVSATVIGSVIATIRAPGPRVTSGVQHFTAGVVIAATAGEVLPDLREQGHLPAVALGMTAGVALLLGLRQLEVRSSSPTRLSDSSNRAGSGLPVGMLSAVAVDLLIDGLLVGLSTSLSRTQGLILTAALTLEVLFIGLFVATELLETTSRRTAAVTTSLLALSVLAGALLGAGPLGSLTGGSLSALLAFGVSALLFLVAEELLVEAHETVDTPLLTVLFFVGFLAVYVLEGLA